MKFRNGFVLREICGEKVVSAEGIDVVDFTHLVRLNETSAYLWDALQDKDFTPETMADLLCGRYEVSREVALEDSIRLCDRFKEAGMVE
jgi:hypothetical protein